MADVKFTQTDPGVDQITPPPIKLSDSMLQAATDEELSTLASAQDEELSSRVLSEQERRVSEEESVDTASFTFGVPEVGTNFAFPPEPIDFDTIQDNPPDTSGALWILDSMGVPGDTTANGSRSAIEADMLGQKAAGMDLASMSLLDSDVLPEQRVDTAREQMNRDAIPVSLGDVYAEFTFVGLPEASEIINFAEDIDLSVATEENNSRMAMNIADDPESQMYDVEMAAPREYLAPIMESLLPMRATGDDLLSESEILLGAGVKPGQSAYTLKEFVQFINPVEYEDSMDIDWGNLVADVFDGDTDVDTTQFVAAMESKYGPQWQLRWGAFLAKEIGVDAAILGMAFVYPPAAALLFAGSKATRARKVGAVVGRATALALGGGAAQSAINVAGGDAANLRFEIATRFLASAAGEGVIKGATVVGKAAFKAGRGFKWNIGNFTKNLAQKHNLKIFNPLMRQRVLDPLVPPANTAAVVARAAITQDIVEYKRLMGTVADGVANPKADVLRTHISNLTGVPEDELAMRLATDGDIFADKIKAITRLTPAGTKMGRAIAALEAQITKLKSRPTPKTERGVSNREKLLQDRADEVTALRTTMQDEYVTTTGSPLADSVLNGNAVAHRLIGETTNRQREVNDMFFTYIADDGFSFRRPDISEAPLSAFGKLAQPVRKFAGLVEPDNLPLPGVVKDFFDALNKTHQFSARFRKMMNRALGPNNKKVLQTLEKGSTEERVFQPNELYQMGLSLKQADSYYATRKLLDFAHMVHDTSLVNGMGRETFRNSGVKTFQKLRGELIEVTNVDKKSASATVRFVKRSGAEPTLVEQNVPLVSLKPLDNVIDFHQGYLPRAYKDANFHVSVLNTKNNTVKRIAATPRRSQAIKLGRELQEKASKGEIVTYSTWNQLDNTSQIGFFKNDHKLFDLVDGDSEKVLLGELEKIGLSESDISVVLRSRSAEGLRGHAAARSTAGLVGPNGRPADLLPTKAAMAEYLQSIANQAGEGEWRSFAVNQFRERFKSVINKKAGVAWHNESYILSGHPPGPLKELAAQARTMQGWLRRSVQHRTNWEKRMDAWYDTKATIWSGGTVGQRAVMRILDAEIPRMILGVMTATVNPVAGVAIALPKSALKVFSSDFNNLMRGIGAVPKLMFFNMAQVFVQGSQTLTTIGTRPVHSVGALRDMMIASVQGVAEGTKLSTQFSREGVQLVTIMRRSGYLDDLGTTDLMKTVRSKNIPILSSAFDVAKRASETPFRLGEKTNRALAFFTSRRELMEQMAKGQLLGLDKKSFKGAIDDDEFLRLVTDRAKITALNMTRAGQLELLSGHGSVLLQFKQVFPKFLSVFETAELTLAQKLGAGAAMIGFWGPTAIPLIPDLFALGDWVAFKANDSRPTTRRELSSWAVDNRKMFAEYVTSIAPEEFEQYGVTEEFVNRLLAKGGLSALTDGEWDIVNRVALGRFVADSIAMADTENVGDAVVFLSVLNDLVYGANAIGEAGLLSPIHFTEFLARWAAGPETYKRTFEDVYGQTPQSAGVAVLEDIGHAISYVGALGRFFRNVDGPFGPMEFDRTEHDPLYRAIDQSERNFFTTSYGRKTGVEVDQDRLKQLLLGITPGKLVEEYDLSGIERLYMDALKDYQKKQWEKYDRVDSRAAKQQVVVETYKELVGFRALLEDKNIKGRLGDNFMSSTIEGFAKRTMRKNMFETSVRR